ncbi:MAG: hypothetical protein NTW14_04675 [bacterium]|nr:hypothetical protein [bacterium]
MIKGAATPSSTDGTIQIRPFPYPYKAALAICNDLDCIRTFAEMKAIHDVLNGRKMTPCGPGLGMEIGDSIHFYTAHPQQDDTLSYFEGTSETPIDAATLLRDGIASGLLDTMHTWGNYSQKGGFLRCHAERAVEELDRYNLAIPVWSNHGDIHNFQNILRTDSLGDLPSTKSRRGDVSEVLEYHTDLMLNSGVRYAWIKSLTNIIGQERALGYQDVLESGKFLGKELARKFISRKSIDPGAMPQSLDNKLIRPTILRDGSTVYEILRYGEWLKDGQDHLSELLTLQVLRSLVDSGGALILYTHLGKGRPSTEQPFSRDSYVALARLAEWSKAGDIWVTTTSRLCRYVELRQRVQLSCVQKSASSMISAEFKQVGNISDPDLAGLTFYFSGGGECTLTIDSDQFDMIRNPVESDGRISYSIPMTTIDYCWE